MSHGHRHKSARGFVIDRKESKFYAFQRLLGQLFHRLINAAKAHTGSYRTPGGKKADAGDGKVAALEAV